MPLAASPSMRRSADHDRPGPRPHGTTTPVRVVPLPSGETLAAPRRPRRPATARRAARRHLAAVPLRRRGTPVGGRAQRRPAGRLRRRRTVVGGDHRAWDDHDPPRRRGAPGRGRAVRGRDRAARRLPPGPRRPPGRGALSGGGRLVGDRARRAPRRGAARGRADVRPGRGDRRHDDRHVRQRRDDGRAPHERRPPRLGDDDSRRSPTALDGGAAG